MADMARRSAPPPPPPDFEENIVDIDVAEEMRGSYLEYAYSVIYQRALPDARDGLKPVQRRILYQMNEMGLRPDRGHVKCARVVGDVMGRLHPHGDSAIYDALVRLGQPWVMRLPLVDPHGNFGSLGGEDPAAAMRYTEARLTAAAMEMVASIDEDTVDFVPNYDGQETEPSVLPSALPNLLVNGASGIAVGMATNMAPHNLGEVIAAARHLIRHPDAGLDALMRFVPGPDLPTGGKIVGLEGIREAYESGRGIFRTRASCRIEQITPRRTGIVVTELPYGVGPEKVIARIKDLVQAKKLTGITDVKDLTDRHRGLQLVIEIRSGFHPEAVLAELYRLTPMEETFGINNVALVDGQPRVLGLRELLSIYVDHRIEVVRRRSEFRRRKREDRLHLVDGLMIALLDIDEVIGVIRSSDDAAAAKQRLMAVFDLSDIQAQYILDTPLRRLTRYDRLELERERDTLQREIAELTEILSSDGQAPRGGLRGAGRRGQAVRYAPAHHPAGRQRRRAHRGGTAGGGGRPVHGAAVVDRAAGADRSRRGRQRRPRRRRPGGPGRTRRDRVQRSDHRARDDRRGDLRRTDDQAERAGIPGPPAERAVPRPVRRHPGRGVRVAGIR